MTDRYEQITARFNPKRTDDLTNGADAYIGKTTKWIASWVIDEGPYEGQWAFTPDAKEFPEFYGWCPECDLEIIHE